MKSDKLSTSLVFSKPKRKESKVYRIFLLLLLLLISYPQGTIGQVQEEKEVSFEKDFLPRIVEVYQKYTDGGQDWKIVDSVAEKVMVSFPQWSSDCFKAGSVHDSLKKISGKFITDWNKKSEAYIPRKFWRVELFIKVWGVRENEKVEIKLNRSSESRNQEPTAVKKDISWDSNTVRCMFFYDKNTTDEATKVTVRLRNLEQSFNIYLYKADSLSSDTIKYFALIPMISEVDKSDLILVGFLDVSKSMKPVNMQHLYTKLLELEEDKDLKLEWSNFYEFDSKARLLEGKPSKKYTPKLKGDSTLFGPVFIVLGPPSKPERRIIISFLFTDGIQSYGCEPVNDDKPKHFLPGGKRFCDLRDTLYKSCQSYIKNNSFSLLIPVLIGTNDETRKKQEVEEGWSEAWTNFARYTCPYTIERLLPVETRTKLQVLENDPDSIANYVRKCLLNILIRHPEYAEIKLSHNNLWVKSKTNEDGEFFRGHLSNLFLLQKPLENPGCFGPFEDICIKILRKGEAVMKIRKDGWFSNKLKVEVIPDSLEKICNSKKPLDIALAISRPEENDISVGCDTITGMDNKSFKKEFKIPEFFYSRPQISLSKFVASTFAEKDDGKYIICFDSYSYLWANELAQFLLLLTVLLAVIILLYELGLLKYPLKWLGILRGPRDEGNDHNGFSQIELNKLKKWIYIFRLVLFSFLLLILDWTEPWAMVSLIIFLVLLFTSIIFDILFLSRFSKFIPLTSFIASLIIVVLFLFVIKNWEFAIAYKWILTLGQVLFAFLLVLLPILATELGR
jgi:hypothetical protein